MNKMRQAAEEKVTAFTKAVTSDPRWDLQDELMCQVFGFTLYGYAFGFGRIVCFMDVADIQQLAAIQLSGLGVGPKYAEGMMTHAHQEFFTEENRSLHAKLVDVGHGHFGAEDLTELIESVFANTQMIRELPK